MFGIVPCRLLAGLRPMDVPGRLRQSPLQHNIDQQVAVENPCPPQRAHV